MYQSFAMPKRKLKSVAKPEGTLSMPIGPVHCHNQCILQPERDCIGAAFDRDFMSAPGMDDGCVGRRLFEPCFRRTIRVDARAHFYSETMNRVTSATTGIAPCVFNWRAVPRSAGLPLNVIKAAAPPTLDSSDPRVGSVVVSVEISIRDVSIT